MPIPPVAKRSFPTYDSRFQTWERWSALTGGIQHDRSLQPVPETAWTTWANQYVALPEYAGLQLPRPQFFKDWRSWAHAINHTLRDAS